MNEDREQEARKIEIMKGVEENGEKTDSESQEDLKKIEITEEKQQVEETTVQQMYHNFSENIINNRVESKMTCNNITYDEFKRARKHITSRTTNIC